MSVFVIATRHAQYQQHQFPEGSTVIDPWRYIPDQPGVHVRRLGENKPEMISLLVPSRGRPERFKAMAESAIDTATYPRRLEFVTYLDADDPKKWDYPTRLFARRGLIPYTYITDERIVLSECWNRCYAEATGEILMHCGDDILFRTNGWDQQVRNEFRNWPDRIVLVQGDDLSPNREALATHGFLHRRWVETVGYFVPPLFSSDWNDVWLTEVADMIGRRIRLPFVTEHLHYSFEKSEYDETYREREARGLRDDVNGLFQRTKKERARDAALLKAAMA